MVEINKIFIDFAHPIAKYIFQKQENSPPPPNYKLYLSQTRKLSLSKKPKLVPIISKRKFILLMASILSLLDDLKSGKIFL